jgi:hypothetical protein
MSVKELVKRVQALPPRQLERFGQWFDGYRQNTQSVSEAGDNGESDMVEAQKQEILR